MASQTIGRDTDVVGLVSYECSNCKRAAAAVKVPCVQDPDHIHIQPFPVVVETGYLVALKDARCPACGMRRMQVHYLEGWLRPWGVGPLGDLPGYG